MLVYRSVIITYLDLLKVVGQKDSPNGGFMVIYYGRIRKTIDKKNIGGCTYCCHENHFWPNYPTIPKLELDVSENSGTTKSSILIGFSIINHPFWGLHIFWKHLIVHAPLGGIPLLLNRLSGFHGHQSHLQGMTSEECPRRYP